MKKNTVQQFCEILLQFKVTLFCFKMYFIPLLLCKAEFSAVITPVSHDPSEIILICWFADQETFLIIVNVKNSFDKC